MLTLCWCCESGSAMQLRVTGANQVYQVVPITANSGHIKPQKGKGFSARRLLTSNQTAAAASYFLNPDGSVFHPGGTSW